MSAQLITFGHQSLAPTRTPIPAKPTLRHGRIQSCSCIQDLKGQTVVVVGLGVSGRAAARLALVRGATVIAIDQNKKLGPLERDPLFEKCNDLRTILGHCDKELLEKADRVVVSPGVPLENYGLSFLLQSGRPVVSELDFAAEVLPKSAKILAVTGTNGKSTVTTFAGQMLSNLGSKVFIGGNLGNPLSDAAIKGLSSSFLEPFEVAVVEVSSYQMEIPHKHFCPSVAVLLNLTPDHLERHKTMRNYAMTKCRLFSHMNGSKLAVLPIGNQHLNEALKDHVSKCNVVWIGDFPGVKVDMVKKVANFRLPTIGVASQIQLGALKAIGNHNYYNAAVAAFCVLALDVGIDGEAISAIMGTLHAPPHRMQIVYSDTRGITWVDDSKATNVEATYTALTGLNEQKSVVLLGGLAKVLDIQGSCGFERLVDPLKYHRCVITFGSSGSMIQKTLWAAGLSIPCIKATNLEDAVNVARNVARLGDTVILSPGCASFDEFSNFEHRGRVSNLVTMRCCFHKNLKNLGHLNDG
ncbi:PREDICTED: uncharacterized protein LOC104597480 isoform X2 [Nelumbo nucifera]|uniref:Uncharacterized protein LOC104597480 isoform X2 n=1 Tax=Nelumbo nucifera TaxID=4432 RepID=A0A1U8A665_NELNU|nr:PREDICTED: uncharacterized protein LOC104597480 isoform X2 [Nelumbo nucifera]